MHKTIATIALAVALTVPVAASAANTIAASLIPDGTYTATVEKVVDAKHILVKMDNGVETTLATQRTNVDFSKLAPHESIKLSLGKGLVLVYAKD